MESIYYVLCWHCHRRCKHCYEERFRPYIRDELAGVVAEAKANAPRVIANLPARLTYLEAAAEAERAAGSELFIERVGKIILSGGDVLTEPVREAVLYPTLAAIREKYAAQGGVRVVVQTTGDLLTPTIIRELVDLGVWTISVSGMDDFHVGMEGDKKITLADKIAAMLEEGGVRKADPDADRHERGIEQGPLYNMFGANEDTWIGKLWPRGRAWENGLSSATLTDNFCDAWSGGLNFLNHGYAGSEVSIDPNGDVFPCCIKQRIRLATSPKSPCSRFSTASPACLRWKPLTRANPNAWGLVMAGTESASLPNRRPPHRRASPMRISASPVTSFTKRCWAQHWINAAASAAGNV